MERKQKGFSWLTLITVLLTLFPFGEALLNGATVLAQTNKATYSIFQNEAGDARLSYRVDEKNQEVQWVIDYNKTASELPRILGFSLESENVKVKPTAITSNAGIHFTYKEGFLQTTATKEAQENYQVSFTTEYKKQFAITPQILEYDLNGNTIDLLANNSALTISLPALQHEATTVFSSTNANQKSNPVSQGQSSKRATNPRITSRTKEKGNEANLVDLDTANLLGDNKTILLNATLKNDQDQEIKDGDQIIIGQNIILEYNWRLPEGLRQAMLGYPEGASEDAFGGDYFTFELPENFHINPTNADQTLTGELKDDQGTCFGRFVIQADGTVTFHFSDKVENRNDISGTFYVGGTVSDTKGNSNGNVEIKVPFVDEASDTTVHIQEPTYNALEKTVGKVSYSTTDPKKASVTWTIIGNKYGTEMTSGKIIDALPAYVTWNKITVYEYDVADVKADGTLNGNGKNVTATVTIGNDKNKVAVDLPTPSSKVYKVVIVTDIDLTKVTLNESISSSGKTITYTSPDIKNEAQLTSEEELDLTATASTTVTGNATVLKSFVAQHGNIVQWAITYTQKSAALPAVEIYELLDDKQDFCTADGILLTSASQMQSYLQSVTDPQTAVTVKKVGDKYVITMPAGTMGKVVIPIYTKLKTENLGKTVTNSASFTDSGGSKGTHYLASGVVKEADGKAVDFTNKTIPWTITINKKRTNQSDSIQLDKWTVTDTLQDGMYLPVSTAAALKEKITVIRYNKNGIKLGAVNDFTVAIEESSAQGVTKFTVAYTLEKNSDDYFIIQFKANYETLADTMVNNVVYHYISNDVEGKSQADGTYNHKNYYNIGLAKNGTYRYDKDTKNHYVNWGITINEDGHYYGQDAQVVDVLKPGQTYVENSFKVYQKVGSVFQEITGNIPLKLDNKNGTLTITGFKAGEQTAYKVTFDVLVKDIEDEANIPAGTVKNTVQYSDSNNAEIIKEAELSLDNRKAYVIKEKDAAGVITNDPDYPGKKITGYNVTVNPAGLVLFGVTIADEPNEFLNIIPASFKMMDGDYELKGNEDYLGTITPRGYIVTLAGKYEKLQKTLQITYKAEVNPIGKPGKEIQLKNTVKITGDNITQKEISDTTEDKFKISDAGGTAQGVTHKITLHKEDTQSQMPLENVRFDLYRKGSDAAIDTKLTDSEGNLIFEGLTYGTYIVKEGNALEGYYISSELQKGIEVIIKENGSTQSQTIALSYTNEQVGNLKLVKTDAANPDKKLKDAIFALYHADEEGKATTQVTQDANGNLVGDADTHYLTTQEDGSILVENLIPGGYIFKEITAPTGYALPKNPYTTVADVKAAAQAVTTISKTNESLKGTFKLKKAAENSLTALAGAEFTLTCDPVKAPIVKTSQTDGIVAFDLEYGYNYTITETKNPNGYKGDFELKNVALNKEGKVTVAGKELSDTIYLVTNELVTTQLAGTKTWDLKGNDADFIIPSEITIQLERKQENAADSHYQIINEVKTNAAKNWQYQFENLPVYDLAASAGVKFSYRIKEVPVAGFESQIKDAHITNTLKTKKITGLKTWDALATTYGILPNEITVNLEVSADNGQTWQKFMRQQAPVNMKVNAPDWTYNFANLPMYDYKGDALTYRVKEDAPTGFLPETDKYDLHNKLETTTVKVDKIWLDQNNYYSLRPEKLDFMLKVQVGEKWLDFKDVFQVDKEITLHDNGTNTWTGQFTDLPKYDTSGAVIHYGVVENLAGIKETYLPKDGDCELQEVAANGTAVFTNCLQATSLQVTKQWQDFDNQFESRPETVTFELQAYPEGTSEALAKVVTTPTNSTGRYQLRAPDYGTITVNELPQADQLQRKLHYKFVEVDTPVNYEAVTTFNSAGSQVITNQLLTTNVAGEKIWQDANNSTGVRPEQIEIQLLQNGLEMSGDAYTKVVTAAEDWHYEFLDLPKFAADGKAYVYSVKELAVTKDYEAVVTGMNITNYLKKVPYHVQKIWVDNNSNVRPKEITVTLTANDKVVETTVLSADNNWQYTWEQMPQIDEANQVITYQVIETDVPSGYGVTYEQNGYNFVVTNTLLATPIMPSNPTLPATATPTAAMPTSTTGRGKLPQTLGILSDTTSTTARRRLPNTGHQSNSRLLFSGFIFLIFVGASGFIYRRYKA